MRQSCSTIAPVLMIAWSPAPISHSPSGAIAGGLGRALEFRHGGVAGRADSLAPQDAPQGQAEYLDVEPEGSVIDIPHVEGELLVPGNRVSPADLRQTGDSRPDLVPPRLSRCVAFEIAHQQRSWADQAHVAAQDVPELGQFIQARRTQRPSQPLSLIHISEPTRQAET